MSAKLPLERLRVVELSHMVMGPTCGLVLADLGADVIKVERMPEEAMARRYASMYPIAARLWCSMTCWAGASMSSSATSRAHSRFIVMAW
jgi:crotonobetainyl-CoA:carnitine CoA-transferase CaiB-like acyl-CoA transferase